MDFGGSVAIVAYRSLVGGAPTGSLDIQARWFSETDPVEVRRLIGEERFSAYSNADGETVCWELVEVFAIERFAPSASGDEIAGFIAKIDELSDLAN